jgi:hypothetical protein
MPPFCEWTVEGLGLNNTSLGALTRSNFIKSIPQMTYGTILSAPNPGALRDLGALRNLEHQKPPSNVYSC